MRASEVAYMRRGLPRPGTHSYTAVMLSAHPSRLMYLIAFPLADHQIIRPTGAAHASQVHGSVSPEGKCTEILRPALTSKMVLATAP